MYNVLPQALIDAETVSTFQSKLTQLVKARAQSGETSWREAFDSPAILADWLYPDPPETN